MELLLISQYVICVLEVEISILLTLKMKILQLQDLHVKIKLFGPHLYCIKSIVNERPRSILIHPLLSLVNAKKQVQVN